MNAKNQNSGEPQPLSADVVQAARSGRPALLQLIGNTPLVPLTRINPNPNVQLLAKLECFNPGGSVKDRIALAMVERAEKTGELTREKTILEATSGNTGIGLAMVAAAQRYKILLAMSEGVSVERRKILAALGAEFLLTPAELGTDGAIEVTYDLAAKEPDRYCLTDQYNNEANISAHFNGTAVELWQQTDGKITHFVASMGTTGTLMGCSNRLRQYNPDMRIIGVEPHLGHHIQGLKNMKEAYQPGIYAGDALNEKINVDDDAAYEMSRRIAKEEGLLVGMSSGAAMHVAVETVCSLTAGVVVVVLPDGGERYLSTPLFQVIEDVEDIEPASKLRFLNTLTRRAEVFEPLNSAEVTMYSCGPTVDRLPHLGLYRRVLVADLARRTLEMEGFAVKHVMNITDIDDRTLREAERAGVSLAELTDRQTREFLQDLDRLGVKPATAYPKASEFVEGMIGLTRRLVENGHGYEKLKSVYFDIGKFAEYGQLSGADLEKIRVGTTVDLDSYEKQDPRDFTLLKRSTLAELKRGVSYKTEWGNVRPGWHIECAVMSTALLGEQYDIHVGGVDLIFPHHENEIAICQAATGKQPANYWLHSGLVTVDGRKMSHSAGNALTVRDLLDRGYTGRQIRGYVLATHYRQPLVFSFISLDAFCRSLRRLDEFVRNLNHVTKGPGHDETAILVAEFASQVRAALHDDLNVSAALAALFRLVRRCNRRLAQGHIGKSDAQTILTALQPLNAILGILPAKQRVSPDNEIEGLVNDRETAREAKDFVTADRLRTALDARGIVLEDTPSGPRWRHRQAISE